MSTEDNTVPPIPVPDDEPIATFDGTIIVDEADVETIQSETFGETPLPFGETPLPFGETPSSDNPFGEYEDADDEAEKILNAIMPPEPEEGHVDKNTEPSPEDDVDVEYFDEGTDSVTSNYKYYEPKIEEDKTKDFYIILPTLTHKEASEALNAWIDKQDNGEEPTAKTSEIMEKLLSTNVSYTDGKFDAVNNPAIKLTEKIVISKEAAFKNPKAYVDIQLGVATPIKLTLPNSGFRVKMKYPTPTRRLKFINDLKNISSELGVNLTSVSMDSLEYFKVSELVLELAKELLINSTLKSEEPFKYLRYEDLPVLMAGILKAVHPKGVPVVLPCVGALQTIKGQKGCTNELKGTIDPNNLLYIDNEKLSPEHIKCLQKTSPNSLEVEEVKAIPFLSKAGALNDNGDTITLEDLYVDDYLALGESVKTSVIEDIVKSFGEEGSDEKALVELSTSLVKYPIIKSISIGGVLFDNRIKNIGLLDSIMGNTQTLDKFFECLKDYREVRPLNVGIGSYTCGCGLHNGEENGLKPINMPRLFTVAMEMK